MSRPATQGAGARVRMAARSNLGRLGVDRTLWWQLAGLAVLAFAVRLVPVLLAGGLTGSIDYDDGVYMGSALSLVRGRIVYRDFFMIHPPGILYVLSPFALLSLVVSDATAFAAARLGFMMLGALNTVLVGLVAASAGRAAALAAAALYAVWIVSAAVEQTTWLVGPQNTLLLLAILVLASTRSGGGRLPIGWRRAALVGGLLGLCGAIQIWGIVTAGVVFAWLAARTWRQPGGPLRPLAAYATAGVAVVAVTFLPFLLAAGEKMVRIIVFDQFGRAARSVPISARLRVMEGIPGSVVERVGIPLLPVILFTVFVLAVALVAWRRPVVRLWLAMLVVQTVFLLVSPQFFGHYGGWVAPVAALCMGSLVGELAMVARVPRRSAAIGGVYGVGLALLLVVSLLPTAKAGFNRSEPMDWAAIRAAIGDARCPTSDSPTVLIETGALRRILENGCPLYVSPAGVSYDTDRNLRGKERVMEREVEYQAIMAGYYGDSDAAIFVRRGAIGLSDETWAAIRSSLPVERRVGRVLIRLPAHD